MMSDWATRPSARARDIDREYAIGLLRDASVDGQLKREEFDRRLWQAMHATTLGDLADLVRDLQERQPVPVPHPYIYQPAPPVAAVPRRRSGAGMAIAMVVGVAVLVFSAAFVGAWFMDDEGIPAPTLLTDPGDCAGDPEEIYLGDCLAEDNPLGWNGMSDTAADDLKDLGLSPGVPIIYGADFDGRSWLSAATTNGSTTYHWHLEYSISDLTENPDEYDEYPLEPIEQQHVVDFYRSTVDPETFGNEPYERALQDGRTELSWSMPAYDHTLTMRVQSEETGRELIELDVETSVKAAVERPDVTGVLGDDVRRQAVATVPGMTYLRSKVGQEPGHPTRCVVEQVWSARPAQYALVRAKATGRGATATRQDDGTYEVAFRTTKAGCTAFDF